MPQSDAGSRLPPHSSLSGLPLHSPGTRGLAAVAVAAAGAVAGPVLGGSAVAGAAAHELHSTGQIMSRLLLSIV